RRSWMRARLGGPARSVGGAEPGAQRLSNRRGAILEQLAPFEKIIAGIGALLVGVVAIVALKNDWKTPGLDHNVTKLLLGLMAVGCVLVLFAAFGALPRGG
ncbi:MAG: hypothetical protein ABR591_10320, partial [Candidatus Velthaea sp.]